MKIKLILLTVFSLTISTVKSQTVDSQIKDSIVVQYIANAGFLIEMNGLKVVIDGFFNNGFNRYEIPDSITQNRLTQNQPPFHDLDLILITHKHADHFNDSLIYLHLTNNKKAIMICPNQVQELMRKDSLQYSKVQNRIKIITPDTDSFIKTNIAGAELVACRLWHGKKQNQEIENNGYALTYKNKTIFHSGDATIQDFNGINGLDLVKLEIDVALLFSGFGGIPFLNKTDSLIHADNYVFMHLSKDFANRFFEPFENNPNLINNPFIFREKMDRKVYYLTDNE